MKSQYPLTALVALFVLLIATPEDAIADTYVGAGEPSVPYTGIIHYPYVIILGETSENAGWNFSPQITPVPMINAPGPDPVGEWFFTYAELMPMIGAPEPDGIPFSQILPYPYVLLDPWGDGFEPNPEIVLPVLSKPTEAEVAVLLSNRGAQRFVANGKAQGAKVSATVTTARKGHFTAAVKIGKKRAAFKGKLDAKGTAFVTTRTSQLRLSLVWKDGVAAMTFSAGKRGVAAVAGVMTRPVRNAR